MSMGPLKFEFKRPALSVSGEVGSLSELIGALQEEGSVLVKMFGSDMELLVTGLGETGPIGTVSTETEAQRKKREKAEAKAKSDAARVNVDPPNAPPPVPVGGATAPDTTPSVNGIPAFLDRTKETAAAAPPPPPTPPVAPPAPPVPPSGVLAGKIIPHIEGLAPGDTERKAWVDWLATSGIVVPGATFEEAMKVIRMQADEKLAPIASTLGIAA